MSDYIKQFIEVNSDREDFMGNTPKALPINATRAGLTAQYIKEKNYMGLQLLFDWTKALAEQAEAAFQSTEYNAMQIHGELLGEIGTERQKINALRDEFVAFRDSTVPTTYAPILNPAFQGTATFSVARYATPPSSIGIFDFVYKGAMDSAISVARAGAVSEANAYANSKVGNIGSYPDGKSYSDYLYNDAKEFTSAIADDLQGKIDAVTSSAQRAEEAFNTKATELEALAQSKASAHAVRLSDNASLRSAIDVPSYDGSVSVSGSLIDVDGKTIKYSDLKRGDVILVTETDKPDLWYYGFSGYMKFYRMETTKVDLTPYVNRTESEYVTLKADVASNKAKVDSAVASYNQAQSAYQDAADAYGAAERDYNTAHDKYEQASELIGNLDKKINSTLTRSQYEALGSYDDNTLYFVAED